MGIEIIASLIAATLSMAAGGIASNEAIKKLLVRIFRIPTPQKSYSDRLSELTQSLTTATQQVDEVLVELAMVAKDREKTVQELEANMSLLEAREKKMKSRIEHLEQVPLPAVEHFAALIKGGETRSAKRDYMLFGSGVVVSTVIAIALKFFGLG